MPTEQTQLTDSARQILARLRCAVVGKDQVLLWVLAAILARGHILLEDVPGVGKTTLALAFSRVLDLPWGRMQFTPDVLPSDLTGYSIPDVTTGTARYCSGAVMTNLFLADELNRATSRTQSALLEAMEEGQVTVDGVCHPLPKPFVVIATQNPTGSAGTGLLPDSQLDRFTVRLRLGYPSPQEEAAMVLRRTFSEPLADLRPAMTRADLLRLQQTVAETHLSRAVAEYAVALVAATRQQEAVLQGASPRATLALAAMAKAVARLRGRDYVIPGDIREVFSHTVAHRLILTESARARGISAEAVLLGILDGVAAPRLR